MNIKILGSGCAKCTKLEGSVKDVVKELGLEATIEKVQDVPSIMKYGVMGTPGLVIDEKVIFAGRTADKKEIMKILQSK